MKIIELIKSKDGKVIRKRVATVNDEPSKTDQSFKKQVNVNNIMAQYVKTGQIKHLRRNQGVFADLTNISDLASAVQQVQKANQGFMALPSDLRKRFSNDPEEFINFIQDPSNLNECYELGIFTKPTATQDLTSSETPKESKTKAKNTNDND